MRGVVRVEDRPEPNVVKPTDAIIRLPATCTCGSDLWPYRGFDEVHGPSPMGHEYVGIVDEVGTEVTTIKPGQFGSAHSSPPTTPAKSAGPATKAPASTGLESVQNARRRN
jgi:threonine dehydrogenase-like Zn-dependent dehydrogenase